MKIVIDTNVLLTSVSSKSPFYWIWEALIDRKFSLCVTTSILDEYAEIIERHSSVEAAESVLETIILLGNLHEVNTYYTFLLIHNDPDDDKFVDCAIACNADFIVTEDKHFKVLKTINWPEVKAINVAEFKQLILPES